MPLGMISTFIGGKAVKTGLGFIKRFWPVIVIGLVVWHYAGLRVKVSDQAHRIDSMKTRIATLNGVADTANRWKDVALDLETTNAELAALNDKIATDAAEWQAAFDQVKGRPPVVRVEYRDRVDGSTAQTMAVTGARIGSEIAEAVRVRREGGMP